MGLQRISSSHPTPRRVCSTESRPGATAAYLPQPGMCPRQGKIPTRATCRRASAKRWATSSQLKASPLAVQTLTCTNTGESGRGITGNQVRLW